MYDLLQGESVITRIDQNVVYRTLSEDPDHIFSLLLVAGYLKTPKKELQPDGSYLCEVSIPNKEIAAVYKDHQYRIKSNRESGDGRYDIIMFPREKKYPGIIMEFKWKADLKEEEMEQFAADALRQIGQLPIP